MTFSFNIRLFSWLVPAFIIATIAGTLLHEAGHYLVARLLGYDAIIHFGSVSWRLPAGETKGKYDWVLMAAGGPLQTMLTGTIGFILLVKYAKHLSSAAIVIPLRSTGYWYFWLRQVANLVVGITLYILSGNTVLRGDEHIVSFFFQLPAWTLSIITALAGAVIVAIVIFRFLPFRHHFTFILAGLTGGAAGYYVWLDWLGKFILP